MERRTGGEICDSGGICLCVPHAVNDRKVLCMICVILLCILVHNTLSDQSRPDVGVDSQSCDTSSQTLRQKH